MCNDKTPLDPSAFNTLTGIMEHFSRVPFEQFQQDLNEWFYKNLDDKGIDLNKLNGADTAGFPEQLKKLVADIYSQAEGFQKKQDNR